MPDTRTILLTGASGMVGKELARQIISQTDCQLIVFLHENGKDTSADFSAHKKRVSVLHGDITQENLGLTEDVRKHLSETVTDIIHCAGSTNFSLPIEESRKYNVEGTKNTLTLARTFKNKVRFAYISTAFVAGKRTGDILEHESADGLSFVNSYEQSKYEAERFLLREQKDIPIVIYRLSTVLGNSKTGEVDKFIAPHQMMRLMLLGLVSMIPGTREYPVDLIAVDHASSTIVRLFTKHFLPGEIFHITAGVEHSYLLGNIIDDTFTLFKANDPEWGKREIAKPLLVSKDAFDLFLQSVEETGNPLMLQIVNNTKYFADQLLYPKNFKRDNVLKYIPDYDSTLPPISEFYARVLKFCVMTNWGRKHHD